MFPNGATFECQNDTVFIVGYHDEGRIYYVLASTDTKCIAYDITQWSETINRKLAKQFSSMQTAMALMSDIMCQGYTKVFIEDITSEMEKFNDG